MSTIAAGTTTTNALVSTGNTDGTLQFQVNGTTPSITLNTLGAVGVGSSPSYGTSGQVLTSAGSTAAPTWAAAPSPAGGATATNPMSTNITLTSSSNRVQVLTPNAFDLRITLPDATTLSAAGGPIFTLINTVAPYPVAIMDSAGNNVGWVVADYQSDVYLTSTGAATGNWIIKTGNTAADGGLFLYDGSYIANQSLGVGGNAIGTALSGSQMLTTTSTGISNTAFTNYGFNTSAYASYNTAGSSGGSAAMSTSGQSYYTCPLSSTQSFTIYAAGSNTWCYVNTWTSGAPAKGTELNLGTAGTVFNAYAIKINATSALIVYNNSSDIAVVQAISISGTTCTAGNAVSLGVAFATGRAAVLSSTLAHIVNGALVYRVTMSGTTITLGNSASLGANARGIVAASSTTSMAIVSDTSGAYGQVVTDAATPTVSSAGAVFLGYAANGVSVSPINTNCALVVASPGAVRSSKPAFAIVKVSSGAVVKVSSGVLPATVVNNLFFGFTSGYSCYLVYDGNPGNSAGPYLSMTKLVATGGV